MVQTWFEGSKTRPAKKWFNCWQNYFCGTDWAWNYFATRLAKLEETEHMADRALRLTYGSKVPCGASPSLHGHNKSEASTGSEVSML